MYILKPIMYTRKGQVSRELRKGREGLISLTDLDIIRQRFLEVITQRRLQVVRMTDLHSHLVRFGFSSTLPLRAVVHEKYEQHCSRSLSEAVH